MGIKDDIRRASAAACCLAAFCTFIPADPALVLTPFQLEGNMLTIAKLAVVFISALGFTSSAVT
jgi:hypothetical protein